MIMDTYKQIKLKTLWGAELLVAAKINLVQSNFAVFVSQFIFSLTIIS
jgi:hypothetical protein